MKRFLIGAGVAIVLLLVAAWVWSQQLGALAMLAFVHAPSQPFSAAAAPPAPDYSQPSAWAVEGGDAGHGPPGAAQSDPASRKADVFFIYPTTYFSNDHWNAAVDDVDTNNHTDEGPLLNQASAFNLCCRVYAPRYRQMTFSGFIHPSDNSRQAMDLAYLDVKRAFEYYLAHDNHGRPFIIASHSQGSRHARRLIAEMIDGTPLAHRMVAAYVIGNWMEEDYFAKLKDVKPCERADDTGCVLTWSTLLEGANVARMHEDAARRMHLPQNTQVDTRFVCTNPLSWSRGAASAPASLDVAWLHGRGDTPRPFDPGLVSARCDNGALFISKPSELAYNIMVLPGENYHVYDYSLFFMNIRKNANDRVNAFAAGAH